MEVAQITVLKEREIPGNGFGIQFLGQAGFMLSCGKGVLCVDPYLSNSVERLVGPEARRMWVNSFFTDEIKPDAILITHDHLDHLDPETIPVIEQVNPPKKYFAPDTAAAHLGKLKVRKDAVVRFMRGDTIDWGGMQLTAVYAEHTEDSIGLVIQANGLKIYITGDTCLTDRLITDVTMNADVVIACVNGIDENLNPDEAAYLAKKLGAKMLIPMHYGLLPCSTVSQKAVDEAAAKNSLALLTLKPEQAVVLLKTPESITPSFTDLDGEGNK